MAIDTSFSAGVLTFTGDFGGVSNDTVIIQSTTTPGTIDYDDGSGLGSQTQAGVTQVIFNAGAGNDSLIISQPDPGIFAPAGGITFNGGAGSDTLTMAGGTAITFTSGSYDVSGPDSGTITYNTTGGVINVPFTGVELINDTTISGAFTTNTTGGDDSIVVEPGPTLPPVNTFSQGPVFIDGGDREEHGFSSGAGSATFPSWMGTGSVTSETAAFGVAPTEGIRQALVTNGTSSVPDAALEAFLGLGAGTLDGLGNGNATEGSAVKTTVTVAAGQTLSLNWNFLTNEATPDGTYNDFSFVSITPVGGTLATLANTFFATFVPGVAGFGEQTGYQTFNYVFPMGGTFTIGLGVVDVTDTSFDSGLLVDNVRINGALVANGGFESFMAAPVTNVDGWKFIEQAIDFVHSGSFIGAPNDVLIIGANGGGASAAYASALSALGLTGTTITATAGVNSIATVDFTQYDMIIVPTEAGQTSGGITNAQLAALAARVADIQTYVRAGGGIFALSEETQSYPWLQIPAPFTVGNPTDFTNLFQTPALAAAGFVISNAELTNGTPVHNTFTGPVGFNGLDVFVVNSVGEVITLGQGAINQVVGGGITTRISGNFATLQTGQKTALAVNSLGGDDSILVDGSVNSLDGLIAPLTIDGGPGTNSLAITDSADLTGDTVSVLTTTVNGLASFPLPFSNIQTLTVTTTQGDDIIDVDFTPANVTTLVTVNSGDGNDTFGNLPTRIRPSLTTQLQLNGGSPIVFPGDRLNLDMSGTVAPIFVDTVGGQAISQSHQSVNWTSIETYDVIDDSGPIPDINQGDLYVRTTAVNDYVAFSRGTGASTRTRVNNAIYTFFPTTKIVAYGRGGSDFITASNIPLPVEFHGEDGNDYLTGGVANDFLSGGQGNDRINGSSGDNVIWGDDSPVPDSANPQDSVVGGDDVLSALGGADVFYGGGGNDFVSAGAGNDYAQGGFGDDTLDGNDGDDRLYGGAGNDKLGGYAGNDLLSGGVGNDELFGHTGNDVLLGGAGADLIDGGDGNDLLISGTVSNENSSRTSLGTTATFPVARYTNPADNDAALLVVLSLWGNSSTVSGTLGAISHDGDDDDLSGGLGDDDFCWEMADILDDFPAIAPADYNAPMMGSDQRIAPIA